mmetsp:Transcript_80049/g.185898  ORF Transcript_80049/g.185898 Transcript_80049/m.185898 type:complete len:309 (-) Transcript_80049:110-1036(-)
MPHSKDPRTGKLDPRAGLLSKDLKAQLQDVLTENTTQAAARCARICEERIEAARREERRRHMLEKQISNDVGERAAQNCTPWTRGFFDFNLEDLQKPSQVDLIAPNIDVSARGIVEKTPFGEVDCVRLLKNSFSIKERINDACRQGNVERRKTKRVTCSTQKIMQMTGKLMQDRGDEGVEQPPPPPGGSLQSRGRSGDPPQSSVGSHREGKQRSAGRRSNFQEAAQRGSIALGDAPRDEAMGPSGNCPPAVVPPAELPDGHNSRLEAAKRKTAQSLELSRVLEELTEGLRTARIISPADGKVCPAMEV